MNAKIKTLLNELYEADPSLKKEESRLIPLLEKLLSRREEIEMDGNFREELRRKLMEYSPRRRRRTGRIFALSTAAAALVAAGFLIPLFYQGSMGKSEAITRAEPMEQMLKSAKMTAPKADRLGTGAPPAPSVSANEIMNTENYSYIAENSFRDVSANPLSTFSIDVDTASYSNVRRFLNDGMMPPPDAVRIEELINYFPYDYTEPTGDAPFAVHTGLTRAPWNGKDYLLRIGLQGKKVSFKDLPPNNLVFLLDVSGSMNDRNKLPLLKRALQLVVDQMREEDRISIVVYAGAAGTVLEPTDGAHKDVILNALDRLEAGGSTAGGEGIKLAYEKAGEHFDRKGNNRIILATDGDFNVGTSSDGELTRLVEQERKSGIYLTVLGFGTGNLKDSRMEQLADKGNGNYAYIDSLTEARKVLVQQMGGTFFTIAKDVKIQLEFNPAVIESYRLIGYENRMLNSEDFNDDSKDAGELGAGHSVTALYELVPATGRASSGDLKYQSTSVTADAASGSEALTVKLRYKDPGSEKSRLLEKPVENRITPFEQCDSDFRFASSVALWGMILRDSEFRGDGNYEQVLHLANNALGDDSEGYRKEFIALVKKSRELSGE